MKKVSESKVSESKKTSPAADVAPAKIPRSSIQQFWSFDFANLIFTDISIILSSQKFALVEWHKLFY